jgi:hypothetical protein
LTLASRFRPRLVRPVYYNAEIGFIFLHL